MQKQRCDVLIHGGPVVTMDPARTVHASGAVAIAGDRIAAVGPESDVLSAYRAERAIDAGGGIVHPGFIDAHNHIVHTSCRGVFADVFAATGAAVNFADWKASVTAEDEAAATSVAALEMLRCGFTLFVEPGSLFSTGAAAEAIDAVGMRALLAPLYLWDRREPFEAMPALASRRLMARAPIDRDRCLAALGQELTRNRDPAARVRGYVFVYGEGTASPELLQAAHGVARAHDVPLHLHVGYVPKAAAIYRALTGRTQVEHLDELGVLDEHTVIVHANVLSAPEEALVRAARCQIVWCPTAFFSLGIASQCPFKMAERYRQGTRISLGTDGAFDATPGDNRRAARFQSQAYGDPVPAGALLEMQTVHAAAAAGLDAELGSLEAGKRADVVVHAPGAAGASPGNHPVHALALGLAANTVDTVLVDGRPVLEGGRSTRVDEAALHAGLRGSVARRAAELGLDPGPTGAQEQFP